MSWGMIGSQIGMVMSGFMFGAKELNAIGWITSAALGIQALIWVRIAFRTLNFYGRIQ